MPATNTALWLPAKGAALTLGPAPYPTPRAGEIVVRNRAVAINPLDLLTQSLGGLIAPWLRYPTVPGTDVAGDVVEVGPDVDRFRVGDRVLGHAVGFEKARNTPAEGAFQIYTILLSHMASPIPDTMGFEEASVLPLGLSTAACALFQRDLLALEPPSAHSSERGRTVLVWGGSTSVGSNAIQLAVAAGYGVVATASPSNFAYVQALGARQAFDYRSPTVIDDVGRALAGRTVAGAVAIGQGSTAACLEIMGASQGRRFVAIASPPVSLDDVGTGPGRLRRLIPAVARMGAANLSLALRARRLGVATKFIWGGALLGSEVGPVIYETFLPDALREGRYRPAPEPLIAGRGLDRLPAALELHRRGVSARKVVVTL